MFEKVLQTVEYRNLKISKNHIFLKSENLQYNCEGSRGEK